MFNKKEVKVVLFIVPNLSYGGAELLLINQINEITTRKEYDLFLVVLNEADQELLNRVKLPNKKIFILRKRVNVLNSKSILKGIYIAYNVYKIIRSAGVNKIVSHLPISHYISRVAKIINFCCFKNNLKLIQYHHSLQYQASPLDTIGKKIFNYINKTLAFLLDNHHLFVSNSAFIDIKANFYVPKYTIIPNGIEFKEPNVDLANKIFSDFKVEANKFKIIIPGRIQRDKGQLFFINSLLSEFNSDESFEKIFQEVQVVFAGGGPDLGVIKEEISKSKILSDRCIFCGFVSNDSILALLKCADLVLIPSLHEGFGIIGLEAMSVGAKIMSSSTPALFNLFSDEEGVLIFENGNSRDLIDKLKLTLKDFKFLKTTSYKKINQYSIENNVNLLLTTLAKI
jgi:glycosyltransferase involved in cell wall biosynthesis